MDQDGPDLDLDSNLPSFLKRLLQAISSAVEWGNNPYEKPGVSSEWDHA